MSSEQITKDSYHLLWHAVWKQVGSHMLPLVDVGLDRFKYASRILLDSQSMMLVEKGGLALLQPT